MATFGNGRRVAIVAGVRTPFIKAGTAFKSISAIDLGKLCVAELIQRTNLNGDEVQALVFGTVIPNVVAPNIAREIPRMRIREPGDHRRCRSDSARSHRLRDRGRCGVTLERADSPLAGNGRKTRS